MSLKKYMPGGCCCVESGGDAMFFELRQYQNSRYSKTTHALQSPFEIFPHNPEVYSHGESFSRGQVGPYFDLDTNKFVGDHLGVPSGVDVCYYATANHQHKDIPDMVLDLLDNATDLAAWSRGEHTSVVGNHIILDSLTPEEETEHEDYPGTIKIDPTTKFWIESGPSKIYQGRGQIEIVVGTSQITEFNLDITAGGSTTVYRLRISYENLGTFRAIKNVSSARISGSGFYSFQSSVLDLTDDVGNPWGMIRAEFLLAFPSTIKLKITPNSRSEGNSIQIFSADVVSTPVGGSNFFGYATVDLRNGGEFNCYDASTTSITLNQTYWEYGGFGPNNELEFRQQFVGDVLFNYVLTPITENLLVQTTGDTEGTNHSLINNVGPEGKGYTLIPHDLSDPFVSTASMHLPSGADNPLDGEFQLVTGGVETRFPTKEGPASFPILGSSGSSPLSEFTTSFIATLANQIGVDVHYWVGYLSAPTQRRPRLLGIHRGNYPNCLWEKISLPSSSSTPLDLYELYHPLGPTEVRFYGVQWGGGVTTTVELWSAPPIEEELTYDLDYNNYVGDSDSDLKKEFTFKTTAMGSGELIYSETKTQNRLFTQGAHQALNQAQDTLYGLYSPEYYSSDNISLLINEQSQLEQVLKAPLDVTSGSASVSNGTTHLTYIIVTDYDYSVAGQDGYTLASNKTPVATVVESLTKTTHKHRLVTTDQETVAQRDFIVGQDEEYNPFVGLGVGPTGQLIWFEKVYAVEPQPGIPTIPGVFDKWVLHLNGNTLESDFIDTENSIPIDQRYRPRVVSTSKDFVYVTGFFLTDDLSSTNFNNEFNSSQRAAVSWAFSYDLKKQIPIVGELGSQLSFLFLPGDYAIQNSYDFTVPFTDFGEMGQDPTESRYPSRVPTT